MDTVLANALKDAMYRPYCLGCQTMERMAKVEPFLWKCRHCGTTCDRRMQAKEHQK